MPTTIEPATTPDASPPAEPVLLVDDDQDARAVASVMLRRAGYGVRESASAEEAIAILGDPANEFCLVATDIIMPGMDGSHLITRIRGLRPGLPMLAISGWSDLSFGDLTVAELGVDEDIVFLAKPYSAKQLVAAVEKARHPTSKPWQTYYPLGANYDD